MFNISHSFWSVYKKTSNNPQFVHFSIINPAEVHNIHININKKNYLQYE